MDPIFCTRIPVEFVKSIDAWASAQRITRAETRAEAPRRVIEVTYLFLRRFFSAYPVGIADFGRSKREPRENNMKPKNASWLC
jgi:hypothetical protein